MRIFSLFATKALFATSDDYEIPPGEGDLANFMDLYQRMRAGGSLSEFAKDFVGNEETKCDGEWSDWMDADDPSGLGDHEPLARFGVIGYSDEDITIRYCCKQSTRKDLVLVTGASRSMIKDNESIINWLLFHGEEVQEYTTFWVGIYDTGSFQKYSNVDEVIGALRTINGLLDHSPSCTVKIFDLIIKILDESNFQARIFGFLDRDIDKGIHDELLNAMIKKIWQTQSTMQLFQTGRSDPLCSSHYGTKSCFGPRPSDEQLVEQFEAMSSNLILVSNSADYCQEDENIEPAEDVQEFVQMISKPDLLALLIETPII
ncbi:Oidioi.mRNA.OKI2018_I69.chr1.g2133.t1.cds [Oikopleura dioica]|uniref:Oidioi.mRNA.OKI2018_I69.chr1.g2133.t1.cds n=1 Tax=Oikopleura dioica TaxID=34765 RepID=A0ABN7SV98_OIKDI|nr:Oidioi.mRNA.OKI2018_I69.chr1.g2133.t1.cds [Oikopleura dioica]